MGARKPVFSVMVVCAVLAGWLVWACVPALAEKGYAVTSCSPPGGFDGPVGVGVDDTSGLSKGDVYVTDQGHNVLDKFTAGCELLSHVEVSGAKLSQLTVEEYPGLTEGDVYVAGQSSGVVYRFSPGLVLEKEIKGLSEPTDVAVDQPGNMFVTEYTGNGSEGKVLEFSAEGEPVNAEGHPDPNNTIIERLSVPQALAVNSTGTTLYLATAGGTIKYTLSGGVYTAGAEPLDPNSSTGVTIAPSGDVYIAHQVGLPDIGEYEPSSGVQLNEFGQLTFLNGAALGVGVNDELHRTYVANSPPVYNANLVYIFEEGFTPEVPVTEPAKNVHSVTATLEGELKSGGGANTGYYFRYNTGENCEGGQGTVPGLGTEGHVQTEAVELEARTKYTFCLAATNRFGTTVGPALSFETPVGPPTIGAGSASPVGVREATVSASVNPENTASGYEVEYGTGSTFQTEPKTTPKVSVGEGGIPVSVSAQLTGLEPGTEYYFRIVAKNANGETTLGAETSFTTLPTGTAALPDSRTYEMVSPPEDGNSDVESPDIGGEIDKSQGIPTTSPFQVATDGSAITYPILAITGAQGEGGFGDQYIAERTPAGGWSQSSIQPNGNLNDVYQGFSSDLSIGILQSGTTAEAETAPPLTPEAPGEGYTDLYERSINRGGYRPLITTAVKLNRSPTEFGTIGVISDGVSNEPTFAGASADFKDLLFEANDALLAGEGTFEKELEEDVKGEIAKGRSANYLYDEVGGRLSLVDVSSEGKVVPDATFGALPIESSENPPDFSHVISADGRFVYWTDVASGVVYVREGGSSTVQVSGGAARYWTASSDGRYALYTEGERKASELYRFAAEPEGGHAQREVLTGPDAGVLGVLGASEDGETVYFVAEGVLSGENGSGVAPVAGKPNLYVSSQSDSPVFIGTLSERDGNRVPPFIRNENNHSWGDWQPGFGQRTARVTGDGGGIVFMSNQSLSVAGYPQGYPSNGLDEVYVYNLGSDRLYCASCGSTGEALSRGVGAAGYLPVNWQDTYLPQWISEDGSRVFFDSGTSLVAQDTNGRQDVYEWEREGYGSCTHGAGSTGGCVFLLSGGTSEAASWFVGASANGNDAFLVTRAQLVPEDGNDAFDLYDVRVDGVKPVTPPVCTGSGCQGIPAPPPLFAIPPSVTFEGVGNFPASPEKVATSRQRTLTSAQKLADALKVCRRDKHRKKRLSCEARTRKHYRSAVKSRKSSSVTLGRNHV